MATRRHDELIGPAPPSRLHAGSPPRYARPFVVAFVAMLAVCTFAPFNLWPFSNWELFSRLRTDRQTGWAAVAVESTGAARAYPVGSLPNGYRGFAAVLSTFSRSSGAKREASCAGWLRDANEALGTSTRLVRIYHLTWDLSDRRGEQAAPGRRNLAWLCSTKGAHEAG